MQEPYEFGLNEEEHVEKLAIEPISSIEIAKYYSQEDSNNGLMFHKNICDSIIVND